MKLPTHKADVVNVNTRKEKHGDDNVLAVDVKMIVKGAPALLDAFDSTLRTDFFGAAQGQEHIPKHPEIGSFTWDREFEDATITIGDSTYEKVTLKGFVFTCREGGVVSCTFTASWLPNADDIGPLAELIKEAVDVEFTTQFDLLEAAA